MTALVWDEVGDRRYETGVDRGVLYLRDGSAVPWNGITSVVEASNNDSSAVYYDGRKISDMISLGDFSGSLRAFTYPDEFLPIEGLAQFQPGVYLGEQRPQTFGLSYRSKVGNDVDPDAGHKLHVLYNLTAKPKDKNYATITDSLSAEEFEWDLSGVPEEVQGFAPAARIILDTTKVDPTILADVEEVLYGTSGTDASLIPMHDLLTMIGFPNLLAVEIVDNGDGTWTAIGDTVVDNGDGSFTITNANAVVLDADTYRISSTLA
jgi:hypothetical protein